MSSIQVRLKARILVLTRWVSEGAPKDGLVPKSMRELLSWDEPRLGIERIGHRNACTTTHPQNGPMVRECMTLMSGIARRPVRARAGADADNKRLRQLLREADDLVIKLTGQWHSAREEADSLRKDLTSISEQLANAQDELAHRKRNDLKVVKLRA